MSSRIFNMHSQAMLEELGLVGDICALLVLFFRILLHRKFKISTLSHRQLYVQQGARE